MNLPPAIVLGILCFGAGWWVDARWSGGADGAGKSGPRIPAMAGKTGAAAGEGSAEATGTAGTFLTDAGTGKVKTLDDLLKLTKDVPYSTGRVRAEIALRRLTAGQLAALAAEMRARFKVPGAVEKFPRQVLNPLLRRWLTLDPLPAVEFAGSVPQLLDEETHDPCYEALAKAFLTDSDGVTRLLAKESSLRYDTARESCCAAMKDLPPEVALARLVEFDARTGCELRGHSGPVTYEVTPLADFAGRWMKSDARKAMNWALALPPTTERWQILSEMAVASTQAPGGAREAMAILEETPLTVLPAGRFRKHLEELAQGTSTPF